MNLLTTYALNCGLKIGEPFIYSAYFPVPFEKYVLFHAGGGMSAKQYDYYGEVISLLAPILNKEGYVFMQIGGEGDPALKFTVDLRGKTNIHQTAFLLERAALLIGNDSCNAHFASALKTPHVILYGSTSVKNHSPQFGGPSIYIESHRNGQKPSFQTQEANKTVNLIKPEEIVRAALKIMNRTETISRDSLYFGPQYNTWAIETAMDMVVPPDMFPGGILNGRMDYNFDEDILANNLSIRSFSVITEKPVNIDLLKRFKQNVAGVMYNIKEGYSTKFVRDLLHAGIPFSLRTELPEEYHGKLKLDFFDYGLVDIRKKISKENLENHEKMTISTKYKTNKFLLSKGKLFLGKMQWEQGKELANLEDSVDTVALDNPSFYEDVDFYYIYNE